MNFTTHTLTLLLLLCLSANAGFAQDTPASPTEDPKKESPWNVGGDASITFLASGFSDAWTATDGGQDNITIGALANFFAKYAKDNITWDNTLLAQYTTQRTEGSPDFIKTLDKLEVLSFVGYKASKQLSYSGAFSLKTQWTPTYTQSKTTGLRDSIITSFFAPGEILIGPGMKYTQGTKTSKAQTTINVSPATAKFIVIRDPQVADASYDGQSAQFEFGASILGTYRVKIAQNLTYATNVEVFANYLQTPLYVDVKWANVISTNIFKIVTVNLSYDLRYDQDISPQVRMATTFGVGLGYKF